MILWGLKQHVMPWCSDGLGEAEHAGTMDTNLSDWADRAHAQGGFVVNPHFNSPNAFGEYATLIATGRMDAIEMKNLSSQRYGDYYGYLNCGYRLPMVSGTDKMSSSIPVGGHRAYVNIPEDEEFTYESWCRNAARGRTFISGGPMIGFTVDGKEIGDTDRAFRRRHGRGQGVGGEHLPDTQPGNPQRGASGGLHRVKAGNATAGVERADSS